LAVGEWSVEVKLLPPCGVSFQPIYHGTAQTHKVNKLSECTLYHFRVYAANEAGDGPVSTVQTCRTTKAPPSAPKRKY